MRVTVVEEESQAVDHGLGIELRAIQERARDAARRDSPNAIVLVAERADESSGARWCPQASQRIERMPPRRDGGRIGVAHQLRDRRAGAKPPRLQQRRIRHGGGRGWRGGGRDLRERARAVVAADLGDRGDGLELRRPLIRGGHRANRLQQRRDRAGIFQQPQPERRGGRDAGNGVRQDGNEQVHRRRITDPAGSKRRLTAHGGIVAGQCLPQRRRIEATRIGGR